MPVGLMVGGVLLAEILVLVIARYVAPTLPDGTAFATQTPPSEVTNQYRSLGPSDLYLLHLSFPRGGLDFARRYGWGHRLNAAFT